MRDEIKMIRISSGIFLAALCAQIVVTPAAAQFGSIFGPPPRPPADMPPPPDSHRAPPPAPSAPVFAPPPAVPLQRAPSNIESQPLPPPPGSAAAPTRQPSEAAPPAEQAPAGAPPQPANTELQPGDAITVEPPEHRIANPTAVFSGLDKITGRITSFDAAIGETVQFGALQVTPRACYTRPPTEPARTDAFIEVDELTLRSEIRRIFTGWMFAASPGLHAVEHPIYDVWLTDCKGGAVAETEQPDQAGAPLARANARTQKPAAARRLPPPLPNPPD
jgi:hypothetical protein